jgi:hypothetical protein
MTSLVPLQELESQAIVKPLHHLLESSKLVLISSLAVQFKVHVRPYSFSLTLVCFSLIDKMSKNYNIIIIQNKIYIGM